MAMTNVEFLKMVVKHTSESILLINRSGLIMLVARESDEALAGNTLMDVVAKTHAKRLRRAIDDAFRSGLPVTCELRGKFGANRSAWYSCRISPVENDDGETLSAIVFASDITERRTKELSKHKRNRRKLEKTIERTRAVENILTMCAKTKKVRFRGDWLSIEDFLWKRYGFKISHGLCPSAYDEMMLEITEMDDIPDISP